MRIRSGFHSDAEVASASADDLVKGPKLVPIVLRIFVAANGGGGAADACGQAGLGSIPLLAVAETIARRWPASELPLQISDEIGNPQASCPTTLFPFSQPYVSCFTLPSKSC